MFNLRNSGAMPAFRNHVAGWRRFNIVVFATLILTGVSFGRVALASSPEAVQHFNLGNKAFQSGDLAQAEREYRAALKIDPAMVDARQNLAITLAGRGDRSGATEEFQNVIKARPNSAEAHYNLGRVLFQQKDEKAAPAQFRKAAELGSADAYLSLGVLLGESGNLQAAIDAHRKAVHLMPQNPVAHFLLGGELQQKGNLV